MRWCRNTTPILKPREDVRNAWRQPAPADAGRHCQMKYGPYLLLAELTHGCPLHCPYCSNPVEYPGGRELSTEEWRRVFEEAAQLGVLHVGFSGGEPLRRADLAALVAHARAAGLYTNLITSAVGLQRPRAAQLRDAGLDSIQISFQSDEASLADQIAGASAHALKLQAAKVVRELGFPLTVNVVLHRGNIGGLEQIIALAENLEAERWNWPTPNSTAGLSRTARRCCPPAARSSARWRFPGRPKNGWRAKWKSCSSRPIITATARNRA